MDNSSPPDRFSASPLQSAVLLQPEDNGLTSATVVYEKPDRKRRVSSRWRLVDKAIRKLARAQQVAANDFVCRYERSSQNKRDGGIRDLFKNVSRSQGKGRKKLEFDIL